MAIAEPAGGLESGEELYEWAYDEKEGKWVKITARNSHGRRCDRCGCDCPCRCADCLHQCCSGG